jgi:hypothetical protein
MCIAKLFYIHHLAYFTSSPFYVRKEGIHIYMIFLRFNYQGIKEGKNDQAYKNDNLLECQRESTDNRIP